MRQSQRIVLNTLSSWGVPVWRAYPESLVMILLEGVLCIAVFAASAWVRVLSPDERRQVRGLFARTMSGAD
jgi:hypothetical protein